MPCIFNPAWRAPSGPHVEHQNPAPKSPGVQGRPIQTFQGKRGKGLPGRKPRLLLGGAGRQGEGQCQHGHCPSSPEERLQKYARQQGICHGETRPSGPGPRKREAGIISRET